MTMTKDQAKQTLLEILTRPDGTIRPVYTIMRDRSQSGMTKYLTLHVIQDDQTIYHITGPVATLLGYSTADKHGYYTIKRTGAGYDPGHDTVYHLSQALFGDGYKIPHRWL